MLKAECKGLLKAKCKGMQSWCKRILKARLMKRNNKRWM